VEGKKFRWRNAHFPKAAIGAIVVKVGLGIPDFDSLNGRSGEIRCIAKSVPPQPLTNAASATWPNVNVGKVPHTEPRKWPHLMFGLGCKWLTFRN
jgi:hypothetical protein